MNDEPIIFGIFLQTTFSALVVGAFCNVNMHTGLKPFRKLRSSFKSFIGAGKGCMYAHHCRLPSGEITLCFGKTQLRATSHGGGG